MNSPNASSSDPAQTPRLHIAPLRDNTTYGDIAAAFAASYLLTPDPWQQLVLDDWLREVDGKWASLTCGLSVPRQNGKNALVEIRELFGTVGRGEKILHTAHQVKTAQKHFRRLKHFFGKRANDPDAKFPELNALVEEIRNVNGQEAITLKNGGSIEIVARSTGSGRGFTVDVIVCDEAQDMSDDDQEALLATSSSAPLGNPQWIYTGTPPGPKVNGEVFTRVRTEALQTEPYRMSWHEWSAEIGADLDDRTVWRQVNPALLTGRLLWDVVAGERGSFSDEGFSRERLGMWGETSAASVISTDAWGSCADEHSVAIEKLVLGIDINPERTMATVGLAGRRADGRLHVEVVETRQGIAWVAAFVKNLHAKNRIATVVVDARSAAASLIDDFRREGIRVTVTGSSDMGAACGRIYDGVMDMQLVHIGQPQLAAAIAGARKRNIGTEGAWGWNRSNAAVDITPLVAVTLAAWGVGATRVRETTKSKRKARLL
ncbi:MAG: DEAD/DEAH box helicase family protein [Propionibacteriales bacterium]|nr:DEAD/DEAH box helicase family protein [Propionibacteriales bacterium]